MTDGPGRPPEDGEPEGSDWLQRQFEPTTEVPVVPAAPPTAPPPVPPAPVAPAGPVAPAPPPVFGTDSGAPAGASPFPWALQPGGNADEPIAPPPPLVEPIAPSPAAAPATTPPLFAPPPAAAPDPDRVIFPWETPVSAETAPFDNAFDSAPQLTADPPLEAMPFETTRLPEVAPQSIDAPAFWEPAATQLMDQVQSPPPAAAQSTTQFFAPPGGATELLATSEPTSAIDALFGEQAFQEYEAGPSASERPFANRPAASEVAEGEAAPHAGIGTGQRVLLTVAGSLVAVLAIVALFFVGTRLPALLGPAPAVTQAASPTPSASDPAALPAGPQPPGQYDWNQLLGGECLDPYTDPWAETFTVVDCTAPHHAQMVFRGVIPTTTSTAFPGLDALKAQVPVLCTAAGVIDLVAAGQYSDAQISASYPVNAGQWDAGDHAYYCFVSRSSGDTLTGSVAGASAAPVAG